MQTQLVICNSPVPPVINVASTVEIVFPNFSFFCLERCLNIEEGGAREGGVKVCARVGLTRVSCAIQEYSTSTDSM